MKQKTPIQASNFEKAREMLCLKMGWQREFYMLFRNYSNNLEEKEKEEKENFIRKMTRYLCFNYDNHRCPDPIEFPSLWPSEREGSKPIIVPPEYRNNGENK